MGQTWHCTRVGAGSYTYNNWDRSFIRIKTISYNLTLTQRRRVCGSQCLFALIELNYVVHVRLEGCWAPGLVKYLWLSGAIQLWLIWTLKELLVCKVCRALLRSSSKSVLRGFPANVMSPSSIDFGSLHSKAWRSISASVSARWFVISMCFCAADLFILIGMVHPRL